MIYLQLANEPGATERVRYEKQGVSGFFVSGKAEGKRITAPLFSPSRFEGALEAALSSPDGVETLLRIRPYAVDEFVNRIVADRMRFAQSDSIKASVGVLRDRVGVSVARLSFRRLKTALNSSRFSEFQARGGVAPRILIDLVELASQGLEAAWRYASPCAHPDAAFLLSPRQLPLLEGWRPEGPGLGEDYAEAKFMVDKLANYQIDLNRVAEDLERIG